MVFKPQDGDCHQETECVWRKKGVCASPPFFVPWLSIPICLPWGLCMIYGSYLFFFLQSLKIFFPSMYFQMTQTVAKWYNEQSHTLCLDRWTVNALPYFLSLPSIPISLSTIWELFADTTEFHPSIFQHASPDDKDIFLHNHNQKKHEYWRCYRIHLSLLKYLPIAQCLVS